MTRAEGRAHALRAFADLLSYPAADPVPVARRCQRLVGERAARHLDAFVTWAERAKPYDVEEAYSATFDLQPTCAPYVGHHLCGDSPRRGEFLVRLAGIYRDGGFVDPTGENELPDHLSVVLRYLAATPTGEARDALLEDGLLPSLDKMLAALEDPTNAYRSVLEALREEVR
ncbi:MAG TPA: nitrate reductase molybdenum cofactor assembly chaperone [Anaeromyxobacteraceae bacterium]|nr:nitrate reductase molybdenum cofactor assembly chaperone [Anaeromyxobacteraceae bacterium]